MKYHQHLLVNQKKFPTDKLIADKIKIITRMIEILSLHAVAPQVALWNLQTYLTNDIKAVLSLRRDTKLETVGKMFATVVTLSMAQFIGGIWKV